MPDCYQLRRGTPLTRSWFTLALNIQQFATVLTHLSTCFSHAKYHCCVTVYQSDVQSELQSLARKIWYLLGLLFFPCPPIHRHALVMHNTTLLWLSINLMCNPSSKVFARKIWYLLGLLIFPFSHIHRHASVMQNTTIVWLSIDLMGNLSYKLFTNLTYTDFTFSPEFICDHQI